MITADKGLAGAYNQNVLKEAQRLLNEHSDTKLFVVGEYGRRFFTKHQIPIERTFLYTAQNPTLERGREISSLLLDKYDTGELKKIFVVYTDMENEMRMVTRSTRLLPFHRTLWGRNIMKLPAACRKFWKSTASCRTLLPFCVWMN